MLAIEGAGPMTEAVHGSGPKLDLISVLVVEDNPFIRSVLTAVLRSVGVGTIHAAANGADAIRFLQERKAALPGGTAPVDVLITDLLMPEVDGLMLLRWLRTSRQSPDKFMPVLMLSGAADHHYVRQARDLGVTDFIAKPFSAQTVAGRLVYALVRPRRFVLTHGYFGPDRRRIARPVQLDCRMTGADEVLVVHSRTRAVDLERHAVVHFDLPNRLAAKMGLAPRAAVPGFPPDVLEAAEAEIQSRNGDYATWIAGEVDLLGRRIDRLGAEPRGEAVLLGEINRTAHEMRGQGGIFGYPLITLIAKSLYEATSGASSLALPNGRLLLKAHADAIRAVMQGRVSGDGGTVGQQLLASLEVAKRKYARIDLDATG